jgi:periplasmic divalent cation tolerance protein
MVSEMGRMSVVVVLFSHPDPEAAESLVLSLVEEKWVACGHILPVGISLYEWEGKTVRDAEVNVILKAPDRDRKALVERIRKGHPYSVPEILIWSVSDGNPEYLEWVVRTASRDRSRPKSGTGPEENR